jgi:PAS domain S-box-containing protein
MGEYAPIIEGGFFRVVGPVAPILPLRIAAKDVIVQQAGFVVVPYDQQLVQLQGRVEESHMQGGQRVWILRDRSEVFEASLPLSATADRLQDLGNGSVLLLTGICTVHADSDHKPISFGILLRSSNDIVVLQHTSWWTQVHSLLVLGSVGGVTIFVILWVFLLKHRAEQLKYRGIFDTAIIGIFQVSPCGTFLSINPALAITCGYSSPQEMISSVTFQQLFVDPKRREDYWATVTRLESIKNFECEIFHKDGSKIWVSTSVRANFQNGVVVRYEGMSEDVTERKLLRDQLFQAQKLESIGQLAAGIAHEINTPTQYIGDNVRFLKDSFQDVMSLLGSYEKLLVAATANTLTSEIVLEVTAAVERADADYLALEIPKAIDQTLEGITCVSTLVSAMKEFSHPGTKEKTPLDLNRAIESTITVARNEWKYAADLETDLDPLLPMVSCHPGEFNQVILNLIVNAAHAIGDVSANGGPERGTIKVRTRNRPGYVEIRIQDTGGGIPENVQARVFDPFFTTKEIGKGTGQGLAIARSVVVDKHGGSIDFETEAGTGTTFVIRLPHDAETPVPTAAAA